MSTDFMTTAIGMGAAGFSVTSFVPQIIKLLQTRDASAVSFRTYAFTVTCFALWIAYGVRLHAWPIAVANALALVMSATVLILKWRFERKTGISRRN